ncbi:hypothetical protein [Sphingobacterium sp.]|nr:hypothetical protein [Sphingobacterium sp.]
MENGARDGETPEKQLNVTDGFSKSELEVLNLIVYLIIEKIVEDGNKQ